MNKNILAIAVAAAMVATATVATAGEPTIYGKIHVSIDSMDNDATLAADAEDGLYVSSNSSRLGIKGAVDLDGGLKAVYKYEMSTDYSSAGNVNGNRNAYLGLKGGFGQIIAGRHDMPFKTVGRKHDLFGDTIGDSRAIMRAKDSGDDFADRRDNVVMYTNTFGAVGVKVALGQEEGTDDAGDTGIGISFKQGPLKVMFANETHGTANLTGGTKDSTGNILAGSYKMGNMTFLAGYMAISDVTGAAGTDVTGYTLAGVMKSGMNSFKLQYTGAEVDATGLTDSAASLLSLGVDHKLGKKTSVYAVYAAISNDDNVDFNFSDTGHAGTVGASTTGGDSPSGISLGMIHKF